MFKPALRSLKTPGTANQYDKQPADMNHLVQPASGNGGVHVNSEHPEPRLSRGGHAWERGEDLVRVLAWQPDPPSLIVHKLRQGDGAPGHHYLRPTTAESNAVKAGWDAVKVPD